MTQFDKEQEVSLKMQKLVLKTSALTNGLGIATGIVLGTTFFKGFAIYCATTLVLGLAASPFLYTKNKRLINNIKTEKV